MTRRLLWIVLAPCVALALTLTAPALRAGSETINYADLNKIKAEGLQHSQAMELASWLTDVHGPRLTASPSLQKAAEWAASKLKEWGLTNVRIEPWVNRNGFDRGWSNDKFYMQVTAPERFPVPGTPTAWTPGTNGLVSAGAVLMTAAKDEDLAAYKGQVKGKWVLLGAAPDVAAFWDAPAKRYKEEELSALELLPPPGPPRGGMLQARAFMTARADFLRAEGALGTISTIPRGHGLYTISGNRAADPSATLPAIWVAAEHFGRIARILDKKIPVTIEADVANTYYPNPPVANVIGEIPGTDKADEVVMVGAHLDSWHASTGAADNGVGAAAMLETVRILKASGVKLRRTVRIGLWEGEEQGLIGSREYVSAHLATRQALPPAPGAAPPPGAGFGFPQGPVEPKPEYDKFSVYFNIDNGTGALRGLYLQGNDAVAPIFRAWMEPFRSLGMTTLTIRNTGGTDHQSFDAVGLPGFQYIQDTIEYDTIAHHTNMDSYERLQPDDVVKMATISAGFTYLAANRDEKLPRKPANPATDSGRRGGQ
jgi:hypothetical protein